MNQFLQRFMELSAKEQEDFIDCVDQEQFEELLDLAMDNQANAWQKAKLGRILSGNRRCLEFFQLEMHLRLAVKEKVERQAVSDEFVAQVQSSALTA